MKTRPTYFFLSAVILVVTAFSAFGQRTRPDFNRPQTYDVQHYVIRVSFDRAAKTVIGDTTVVLKPLRPLRAVELDAVGLRFRTVKLESSEAVLQHRTLGGKVIVTLDKEYSPDDTVSLRFGYTAKPAKGVYFVNATDRHSAQIWTQGEPDEARHWFPSFDFPSDKATFEQIITADNGETVIGNGELLSRKKDGGKEVWHYKMNQPMPVYLVSFVIGKYARVEENYGDVPLGYYMYPGLEPLAPKAYGRTRDMMRHFEELTGVKYPYNKYDQTMVASFQFGGMENITATTMADTEIMMADSEFGAQMVMDLVSHELAHSWFGNMVTCRNWAELWLNEGFATFFEAVYRERAFGRPAYIAKVRSDVAAAMVEDTIARRRIGLFNLKAAEVSKLFDNPAITYNKGGVVLHMLRDQVGDENFWRGVNIYLTRHRFGSVETPDLMKAMAEASGQELGWFFDQWVYATGLPKLDIRPSWHARSKTLKITVTQTQRGDATVPLVFRLPIEIEIEGEFAPRDEKLDITKRIQTFSFQLESKPSAITWDPDDKVILRTIKERPIAVLP